jgi:hypothetical protein
MVDGSCRLLIGSSGRQQLSVRVPEIQTTNFRVSQRRTATDTRQRRVRRWSDR